MFQIFIIAIAGALGAVFRYLLVAAIPAKSFPYGTLSVNVIGSLLMGVAYVLIVDKGLWSEAVRPFVMTGFLGAFTTFSTFSLEVWQLVDRGSLVQSGIYIVASVGLCVIALSLAIWMTRMSVS